MDDPTSPGKIPPLVRHEVSSFIGLHGRGPPETIRGHLESCGGGEVGLSDRTRTWLLGLWALFVVGVLLLNVLWPPTGLEGDWVWPTGLMAFPVAGSLVLALRPGNVVGRVLSAVGVSTAFTFCLFWYAMENPDASLSRHAEALSTTSVVIQFAGMVALLHLYPTGRPLNRKHAWVTTAIGYWALIAILALLFSPAPLPDSGRPNPFGVGPQWFSTLEVVFLFGLPMFVVLGIYFLIARHRQAAPLERAQLKWFFAGGASVLILMVLILPTSESTEPIVEILSSVLVVAGFWGLPAAIVIAITRYRLYDIDRIVSRTTAYLIVAGVLVAIYAVLVIGLQAVLPVQGSDLAIAVSTLVAFGLFAPLRRGVQNRLNRRFNRSRYESEIVIEEFAHRLRSEVDLDVLSSNLRDVVARTVQPASVRLWLAEDDGQSTEGRP